MKVENEAESVLFAPSSIPGGPSIPMCVIGRKKGVKKPRLSMLAIWDAELVTRMNAGESLTDTRPRSFQNLNQLVSYFSAIGKHAGRKKILSEWTEGTYTLKDGAIIYSNHTGDDRFVNEIMVQWPEIGGQLLTAIQSELLTAIAGGIPFAFINGSNFVSLCKSVGIQVTSRAKTDEIKTWGDSYKIEGVCTLMGIPIIGGGKTTRGIQQNYIKQERDVLRKQLETIKEQLR